MSNSCPCCGQAVDGIDKKMLMYIPLTPYHKRFLGALVDAAPRYLTNSQLIEQVYENPVDEPENAHNCVQVARVRVNKVIGDVGWRIGSLGRGRGGSMYRLERIDRETVSH